MIEETKQREEVLRAESKAEKEQMKAEIDQHRQEIEQLKQALATAHLERQLMEQNRSKVASERLAETQIEELQVRLQRLEAARQLTYEEQVALEDIVVDCMEVMSKTPTTTVDDSNVSKVLTMVVLSERVPGDGAFARQLKRKVLGVR